MDMGDFPIRCAISGVPIPCGTEILVFEMRRSAKHPAYSYPVGFPARAVMGSYGEPDDAVNSAGSYYLYVLPELWHAAGEIWTAAMFKGKPPSLADEIEAARAEYGEMLEQYRKFESSPGYADITTSSLRIRTDRTQWLRRLSNVVLFAPDGNEAWCYTEHLVVGEEPSAAVLQALQAFIAGFMSAGITGCNLLGPAGDAPPFEQYPDLAVDLKWNKAVVEAIKGIRAKRKKTK